MLLKNRTKKDLSVRYLPIGNKKLKKVKVNSNQDILLEDTKHNYFKLNFKTLEGLN